MEDKFQGFKERINGAKKPVKKKHKVLKSILTIFAIVLVVFFVYSYAGYTDYKNNLNQQSYDVEGSEGSSQESSGVNHVDMVGLPNSRIKIRNSSGTEVIGLDHEGGVTGLGNVTFETSGSGFGFFNYIGSQANAILKGFFDNLQVNYGINTTNITSSEYCNSTGCYTVGDFLVDTDTNTQLTEDQVEAYIFDNDNTDNLNLSSYNITSVDCIKFDSGGEICSG